MSALHDVGSFAPPEVRTRVPALHCGHERIGCAATACSCRCAVCDPVAFGRKVAEHVRAGHVVGESGKIVFRPHPAKMIVGPACPSCCALKLSTRVGRDGAEEVWCFGCGKAAPLPSPELLAEVRGARERRRSS